MCLLNKIYFVVLIVLSRKMWCNETIMYKCVHIVGSKNVDNEKKIY